MPTRAAESYRDELVTSNLALARQAALRIKRRLPPSFETDDLVSAGYVGLIRAAERYRPDLHDGVPFPVFARQVVRGAILDTVQGRHDGVAGRHWIAHTAQPLVDAPEPVCEAGMDALAERREQVEQVIAAAGELTPAQREILSLYYGQQEIPLPEIAARLGMSYSWTIKHYKAAIATLRSSCGEGARPARRLIIVPAKPKALRPPLQTKESAEVAAKLAACAAEVDELGALEKELAPLKPKFDRLELLRKSVRSRYDASPAAETFEAKGERFVVLVGARANQSVIDHARLFKAVGAKMFAAIAKTTLKALQENCNCSVQAEVVSVQQIGARSLKTFERGTPELPKAA